MTVGYLPRHRLAELLELRRRIDAEIADLDRRVAGKHKAHMRAVCGTESGYSKHRRAGEVTCEPCRAAHRKGEQDRALRRKLRRSPQAPVDRDFGIVSTNQDDEIHAQRKAS